MAHDEMQQEKWAAGWETYKRRRDREAEMRAYERGYKDGALAADLESLQKEPAAPVVGTIQWAVTQLMAGRPVKRKNWEHIIYPVSSIEYPGLFVTYKGMLATDWVLVDTPDSPCDSP